MKKHNFNKERDALISGEQKIPTHGFIKQFINNLPDENIVPDEFVGRDAEDYNSWGYALFGYWTNAEDICHQIKIFQWIDLYASLERDDLPAFEEAVIDILNLDEYIGHSEEEEDDEGEPLMTVIPDDTLVHTPEGLEARVLYFSEENNKYTVDFGNQRIGMYARNELRIVKVTG